MFYPPLLALGLLALLALTPNCQPHAFRPPSRSLIIGGLLAQPNRYPYLCSIRSSYTGRHLCGGTLLSDRILVTSAYCVSANSWNTNPVVWCGTITNINIPSKDTDILQSVKTTIHPCYEPRRFTNDIALLELNATPIHGRPIHSIINLTAGYPLVAAGWGLTAPPITGNAASAAMQQAIDPFPMSLHEAILPFIPHDQCDMAGEYNDTVAGDLMLCAGYFNGSSDTCAGDSGGPLIDPGSKNNHSRNLNKEHAAVPVDESSSVLDSSGMPWGMDTLVGIVSWGAGCGTFPGVYTRLDVQSAWIVLHGFCACTSITNSSGIQINDNAVGCVNLEDEEGLIVQGKKFGMADSGSSFGCYVLDFEKCHEAVPSKKFSGTGWVSCMPRNNNNNSGGTANWGDGGGESVQASLADACNFSSAGAGASANAAGGR